MYTISVTNNASGADTEGSFLWALAQAASYAGADIPTIIFAPQVAGQSISIGECHLSHPVNIVNLSDSPVRFSDDSFIIIEADVRLENISIPYIECYDPSLTLTLAGKFSCQYCGISSPCVCENGTTIRMDDEYSSFFINSQFTGDNVTFECDVYLTSYAQLSGSNFTFGNLVTLELENWDGTLPFADIQGEIHGTTLSLNIYGMERDATLSATDVSMFRQVMIGGSTGGYYGSGHTLTLDGLTLANAEDFFGGYLYVPSGKLIAQGCTFNGYTVTADGGGLTFNNCRFVDTMVEQQGAGDFMLSGCTGYASFDIACLNLSSARIQGNDLRFISLKVREVSGTGMIDVSDNVWGAGDTAAHLMQLGPSLAAHCIINGQTWQDVAPRTYTVSLRSGDVSDSGSFLHALAWANIYGGEGTPEIIFDDSLGGQSVDVYANSEIKKDMIISGGQDEAPQCSSLSLTTSHALTLHNLRLNRIILTEGATLGGEDVSLTATDAVILRRAQGRIDLSAITHAPTNAYVSLEGDVSANLCLSALPPALSSGGYRFNNRFNISAPATLHVEQDAVLSLGNYPSNDVSLYGGLEVNGGTLRLTASSNGDRNNLRIYNGGHALFENAIIEGPVSSQSEDKEGNIHLYSGGSLSAVQTQFVSLDGILAEGGSTVNIRESRLESTFLTAAAGSEFSLTDCVVNGELRLSAQAKTLHITGNNFTHATITVTDAVPGALIDLSGNTWSTDNLEEIFFMLGEAAAYVTIDGKTQDDFSGSSVSVFTVTNTETEASVFGSLAWAVARLNSYNGEDIPTIQFSETLAGSTISGFPEISLNKNAAILAPQQGVTLEGTTLRLQEDATLSHLTLKSISLTGVTQIDAEDVALTGESALIWNRAEDELHLSGVRATHAGAHIELGGELTQEMTLTDFSELGLGYYRFASSTSFAASAKLMLAPGAVLKHGSNYAALKVYGEMILGEGSTLDIAGNPLELMSGGKLHGETATIRTSQMTISSAAELQNCTISAGNNGVSVRGGGHLQANGCIFESPVLLDPGSQSELRDCTFNKNLTITGDAQVHDCTMLGNLRYNGTAHLQHSGIRFEGSACPELYNFSGSVEDFLAGITEISAEAPFIMMSGILGALNLKPQQLNGVSLTYRLRGEVRVAAGVEVFVGEGQTLDMGESNTTLNIEGALHLSGEDAYTAMAGKNDRYTINIRKGGLLSLQNGNILPGPYSKLWVDDGGAMEMEGGVLCCGHYGQEIRQGGTMRLHETGVGAFIINRGLLEMQRAVTYVEGATQLDNYGTMRLTDCELNQKVRNEGDLSMNRCLVNALLELSDLSRLSGTDNTFTKSAGIKLNNATGDTAVLGQFLSAQTAAEFEITLAGMGAELILRGAESGIPFRYQLAQSHTVYNNQHLSLVEGAELMVSSGNSTLQVNGTLTAENAHLLLGGNGDRGYDSLVIAAGGRAEIEQSQLGLSAAANSGRIRIKSGATFHAEASDFSDFNSIVTEGGGSIHLTDCSIEAKDFRISRDAQALLCGNSFSGSLSLSVGATYNNLSGNDFSKAAVILTDTDSDAVLDLSGNYWGTTDREAIMARISGDTSHVVLEDILLVDPTTSFIYCGNNLRHNRVALGTKEMVVEFTHEIDPATVTNDSVRLVDEQGTALDLSSVAVEGKTIRLSLPELTDGASYRLVLDSSLRDIAGAAMADSTGLGYAALIRADFTAPRVSHIDPAGDFAGTLESLRLYMTEAVDLDSLKAGVRLTGPDGNTVAIQRVRDLGGNVYEIQTAPQTAYGQYTLSVSNTVCDLAGNRLNQNLNDVFGEVSDTFTASFHIADVDLTITRAEISGDISMGTPVTITWQGANASGYPLHGEWTDGVYLSADPRWDINDRFLGSYTHSEGLAEGATYEGSLTAQLSGVRPGDYYILIRSDINGQEQINKESAEWTQNLAAIPVQVTVPRLEVGDLQMGEMTPEDSMDYLVLHQEAGQSIKLTLHSNAYAANMEIFVGYGQMPTRESYDIAWQKGASSGELILPSRTAVGDVYLLVNNKSSALALKYTLDAEVLPMTVTAVTPTTQGRESSSTFDLYGTNFTHSTRVVFVDNEGTEYVPDSLDIISDSRIRVKFNAKKLPAEKLDIIVTNEYEEQVVMDNAVTITASTGAHLKIAKVFPELLGYHIQGTLKIVFENTGSDPMHAPLLTLVGKQNGKEGAIMTMDPSIVNQGFWTSAMPEGFANSVSFLAYSASAPGWLMPSGLDAHFSWQGTYFDAMFDEAGLWWFSNRHLVHSGDGYQVSILNDPSILSKAREYVSYGAIGGRGIAISENSLAHLDYSKYLGNTAKIYYCGWQQPWDFSYPEFNFELGYLGTDNTATLNWYDSFSGTSMPEEQKRLLADALTRTAGGTWGDYVLMLNNNLIYLDELGCLPAGGSTMYDTDSLVTFELMKADGSATPAKTLAASVDMAQEAQGLSLLIARSYGSSISSRFTEGAFGYGWSFNWEMSLTFREDGTAELHAPGSSLVYQPDYRGGYINTTPKDTAVFAKQRDGCYTRTERDGTRYTFAADGKLNSVRDANGNTITCGYDENGQLCTLTHSGGEQLTLTWDEAGHISSVTNCLGDTTTYRYNGGHLVQVTDYLGDSVSYEYSDTLAHALTRVIGTDGVSEHFTYNERGLVESSALSEAGSPLANYGTITLSYGDNGEVTVTDIYGATTTYYYDNKGQVRRAVDVNGNALTYGYDDAGNLVSFTDQAGNTSAYTYDAAGNMLSSTNALGHTITYTYTEQDKLDVLTDALGHQTDYDYDARGNMTAITYADGSMETWSYDTRGNASSWVNRRGGTVRYSYDSAGRLTARRYEDGSTTTFSYDERGKLLSATDTEGTTRYSYDERERLVRIDTPQGHSLSYGYDEHDNRTSMTDEHGNSTLYAYDGFGHLTRVSDGEGKLITAYAYDQGGRLTTEDRGDGTQVLYTYDKSGQATSITTLTAAGETLSFIRYEYDKTGLRTAMHTQDGSWRYTYDKVGQLTRAVFSPAAGSPLAAQDLRYEYDAAGNRTRSVVNGQETLYTVNALNQTTAAGEIAYQYDADGNMISRTDAEGTTLYTWDAENRLIGVQTAAGDVYAYTYNSAGDRVAETHNGITTQYLYDPAGYGNLTAVYDAASGEQSRTYTHGNGLIGFEDALAGRYWYQGDALGSVTGITDGSGNLIATYSYDPFGTTLSATGSIDNPFLWTGLWGLSTEQTGLLSMRARSYDTTTGKFTSADPIGINGGVNIYAYCGNNGISLIDPSGYNPVLVKTIVGVMEKGKAISKGLDYLEIKFGTLTKKTFSNKNKSGLNFLELTAKNKAHAAEATNTQKRPGPNITPTGIITTAFFIGSFVPGPIGWAFLAASIAWDVVGKSNFERWLEEQQQKHATPLSSDDSDNVNSHDPNDLVGPQGYGTGNFIVPGMEMRFMLRFENEAEATAPTHWMRAFTTFDEAYDLDSFTLNSLYVAGNLIELTEGRDSFNQKVVLTVDGKEVLTEIAVNLDRETRELKAEFTALDPQTGVMLQDPLKGMLYPNDETGRGDAFITYTITSKQELATGTTIHNAADIYFDFNDVIPTPEIDYTIDADAAHAELLSAVAQTNGTIRLTWTGEDAEGGSGFGGVGVYVSKDGGDLELWQVFTSELTSVDYIGEAGHDYGFAVVGYDNVGNAEKVKTEPELFATALGGERIESATAVTLTPTDILAGGTATNSERLIASVGYGDLADFYTFTAAADGTYAVALDMLAWEGISLSVGTADENEVYHPQKERLLFMGDAHNAIEGINLRKGETAYIRVGAMEGAVSTDYYELRVVGEVPAAASLTDNNTAETADALVGSAAPASVQGWVGAGDACDFYRLQLAEASNLQLTLSGVDTAARVKIYAEQTDGSRALLSAGTATAAAGLDRTLALTSGSYFIEVAALNPDSGLSNSAYTLELKEQKGKQSTHYMLAAR